MARPLRIEYPGALYHVISRGNAHQDIFKDDKDRNKFLDWIADAVEGHHIVVHAYCLMNNHYHLLIETPEANLSKAIRDINGNYTHSFNLKHKSVGHLFQGRYKGFVIEKEMYLLQVARYIVLNPVRAGMVRHPREYQWSSYNQTAKFIQKNKWLHVDWILGFFDREIKKAKKCYRNFIGDGMDADDPYDDVTNSFLLGSPQFVSWIWETKTNGSEILKEYPKEQRIVGRPRLDEIFENVRDKTDRNSAIKFARFRCGYPATEISKYVKLHPSVVGRISRDKYNK